EGLSRRGAVVRVRGRAGEGAPAAGEGVFARSGKWPDPRRDGEREADAGRAEAAGRAERDTAGALAGAPGLPSWYKGRMATVSEIVARLKSSHEAIARHYPGEAGSRRAVHTVYGAPHLVKSDTTRTLDQPAL